MKSYGTFKDAKCASSHHLRAIVPRQLAIGPANAIGKALPLLTGAVLLGTTCCGFGFLQSHRLKAAVGGDVQGKHPVDVAHPVYSTILASSSRQDVSNVVRSHHRPPSQTNRTFSTEADEYYQKFKKLPTPKVVHDNLDRMRAAESRPGVEDCRNTRENRHRSNKILIIGDVHGCIDELKSLVAKASNDHNGGELFGSVVMVGDLCNKGPYSSQVVRYVRERPYWYSVRGNHDNAALEAALGDTDRLGKEQYSWVKELSDEDVEWMANLPYTIRIPTNTIMSPSWEGGKDVLVVHAGLLPNVGLEEQNIRTMVTVRDLTSLHTNDATKDSHKNASQLYENYNPSQTDRTPTPWAKAWTGPEFVIFGHDAERGIQVEKHAIGLDSGCVYGNKLTGIILPDMELVSVKAAKAYCPIKDKY